MPAFEYTAVDTGGRERTGIIEGDTPRHVRQLLRDQQLLPVNVVEVDMNDAQDAKYDLYVRQIESALESTSMADKAKILGLLARMALVAIHPDLDRGFDWKTAATSGVSPHSPKIDAMAKRVMLNRTCGHIVFVDNVAATRAYSTAGFMPTATLRTWQ